VKRCESLDPVRSSHTPPPSFPSVVDTNVGVSSHFLHRSASTSSFWSNLDI